MLCTAANMKMKRCRAPRWANQRLIFSRHVRSRGGSPLISPDINIRVKGGHLALSGFPDDKLLSSEIVYDRSIVLNFHVENSGSFNVDSEDNGGQVGWKQKSAVWVVWERLLKAWS